MEASITLISALVIVVTVAFTTVVWLLVFAVRQRDAAQAKLVEIADTDGLTGVANRRRLDSALDELWTRAARSGMQLALLFVDADHFKAYNDGHGHGTGDRALCFIADCLRRHAKRADDLVARYGGEEFVVVLADSDAAHASGDVANRKRGVTRLEIPPVTVSIGLVVCRPADGVAVDDMMQLADKALYRSKESGHNRVTVASTESRQRKDADIASVSYAVSHSPNWIDSAGFPALCVWRPRDTMLPVSSCSSSGWSDFCVVRISIRMTLFLFRSLWLLLQHTRSSSR